MSRGLTKPCPMCNAQNIEINRHLNRDAFDLECRRCGRFTVSGTLYAMQKVPDELRSQLSAYTRLCQERGEYPEMLTTENLTNLATRYPRIPPHEKPMALLRILAGRSEYPGKSLDFSLEWDYPLICARNAEEAGYHQRALIDGGYIELAARDQLTVTHKGWQEVQRSRSPLENGRAGEKGWDIFICHASEDKRELVDPLVAALTNRGIRVWYDKSELTIGDSLRRSIDEGLAKSRYGIVVLSRAFFLREWPQHELDGLLQKEIGGKKVILPVWHGVTHSEVVRYSLPLADRVAGTMALGLDNLVNELVIAISKIDKTRTSFEAKPAIQLAQPITDEKWVDLEYPKDSGLLGHLEAEGNEVKWCLDGRIARAVDIEGWELVCQDTVPGRRTIFKLRDRPDNQTLIKRRKNR